MHIDDWNETFLSKLDVDEYVDALVDAGVQAAMVKAKPHTGLCYWPCDAGRMHKSLKGWDFFGSMVEKCHANGIAVIAYFTQIFDNWAYDNHPDWRLIAPDGMTFREYRGRDHFRNGRYGIVCPNNPDYRAYVKENLQELNRKYDFEGMFLDMTFWPEICFCPHCRKRWFEETGREMPRTIDWSDPAFREFAYARSVWMAEYAKFATEAVKEIKPDVTIEHQFSMIKSPWFHGSTELLTEAVDYSGGDYYGGYLQQTFINKYYQSVSPALPFIYHTGRCDPELNMHTTTKTEEQLVLHVLTALLHNGAFLLVDAINPDGSIVPEVYHQLMKSVFAKTRPFEAYVGGKLQSDAGIWFSSHSKYDDAENGKNILDKSFEPSIYMQAPVGMASILRENNVAFDVIGSKNLRSYTGDVIVLSNVASIRDDEMEALEAYLNRGGNLFISGPIGHPRLETLLGVTATGKTDPDFTYMEPTREGRPLFPGFTALAPLTVNRAQYTVTVADASNLTVLATLTLPYTDTHTQEYAAIHSNPPGIRTQEPCAVLKTVNQSKILWTAAPIEATQPYMSRQVVRTMIESLIAAPAFTSNAPKYVEILRWIKEGHEYLAVINEQEESPVAPVDGLWIDLIGEGCRAKRMPGGEPMQAVSQDGRTRIMLDRLTLFEVIEVIR